MSDATANRLGPRVITRRDFSIENAVFVHSAMFNFSVSKLEDIANEFGVERSNEKGRNILLGCQKHANKEVAEKLVSRKFLIDRGGRELPICIGKFSNPVCDIVRDIVVTPENEVFLDSEGLATQDIREAIKFKLFLKSVLLFGRILYTNENDSNLILFEIGTEPNGEGLIEAVFMSGAEESDRLHMSFTETTDFQLSESIE